jgi:hypothetical protein
MAAIKLSRTTPAIMIKTSVLAALLIASLGSETWAQRIEGVRGFDGGVAPFFNLIGPGSLYIDSQGTVGYLYNRDTFQSYTFRTPGGQAWSGALTTLGPNLTVGLIQGANQAGPGIVFPSPARQTPPLPLIQSTIQSVILLQTPGFPQTPAPVPTNQSLQTFPALPDLDQIP